MSDADPDADPDAGPEPDAFAEDADGRDRLGLAVVLGLVGILAGAFVPLAGGWQPDNAWTAYLVLLAVGFAVAATIAVALARIQQNRGLALGWARTARRRVLPFCAGVVVGAAVTTSSVAASHPLDRASLLEDVAMIAIVVILLAIGSVGALDGYRPREPGEPFAAWLTDAPVGPVGFLMAGVGMILIASRLLGPDQEPAGQGDTPFQVGVAMFVAGLVIVRFRGILRA